VDRHVESRAHDAQTLRVLDKALERVRMLALSSNLKRELDRSELEAFGDAANTNALKVVLSAQPVESDGQMSALTAGAVGS
jgi:hypothetical protein